MLKYDEMNFYLSIENSDLEKVNELKNKKISKDVLIMCINNIIKKLPLNYNNLKILEILLNLFGNYNFIINKEKSILMLFVEKRDYNSIKFLLENGAKINLIYKKKTLWDYYFKNKIEDFSILNWLFDFGINVNSLDKNKDTPLILSIKRNYLFSFDLILKNSVGIINFQNKKGNTALHYACLENQFYIFKILLKFNANTSIKNNNNKLPLDLTSNKNMKYILKYNKKLNLLEKLSYSYKNINNKEDIIPENDSIDSFISIKERNLKSEENNNKIKKKIGSFDFELKEEVLEFDLVKRHVSQNILINKIDKINLQKKKTYLLLKEFYRQLKIQMNNLNKKYYKKLKKFNIHNQNLKKVFNLKFFFNLESLRSRFNNEIWNFKLYLDIFNKNQKILDNKLLDFIINKIKKFDNSLEILTYGSFNTNLNLPFSDIDILIKSNNLDEKKILADIKILLEDTNFELKIILTAKFPILKIVSDKNYNFRKIDITIFNKSHKGIDCVDLINNYIEDYENIKEIIQVFKEILKVNNLSDPFFGGLSSYSLILLLISYLQLFEFKKKKNHDQCSFQFFKGFLNFFINFDHTNNYLWPNVKKDFDYNPIKNKHIINENFIIIDPLNKNNNVTKSSFKINEIKLIFNIIFLNITNIEDNYIKNIIIFDKVGKNYNEQKNLLKIADYNLKLSDYFFLKKFILNKTKLLI